MTWDYQTEYTKLITFLAQDTTPWQYSLPPEDGTRVYFMCGKDYKGDTLYDIGEHQDYRGSWWHNPDTDIEGEINSEFGNCDEIVAWKLVKEYYK